MRGVSRFVVVSFLTLVGAASPGLALVPPTGEPRMSALELEIRALRHAAVMSGADRLAHVWAWLLAHVGQRGYDTAALGDRYRLGEGTRPDAHLAVRWYRRAAAAGHVAAEYALAEAYYFGLGVPRDRSESLRRLVAAAEGGVPEALAELSIHVRRGGAPAGISTPADALIHAAFERMGLSPAGSAKADRDMAWAYGRVATALLCPSAAPGDKETALYWLGQASRRGDSPSAWRLGVIAAGGGPALYCGKDWVARQAEAAR